MARKSFTIYDVTVHVISLVTYLLDAGTGKITCRTGARSAFLVNTLQCDRCLQIRNIIRIIIIVTLPYELLEQLCVQKDSI